MLSGISLAEEVSGLLSTVPRAREASSCRQGLLGAALPVGT